MGRGEATEPQAVFNIIPDNQRQIAIGAGATYSSWTPRSCKGYAQIQGYVYADQESAPNGFKIYQSIDGGANWDLVDQFSVVGGTPLKFVLDIYGEKIKITYTNGGLAANVRIGAYLIPIGSNLTIEGIEIGAVDIIKWGGTPQTGADLTPFFSNLDHPLSSLEKADDSGTATSGGANTLTDTAKNWDVNIWQKGYVRIYAGTGAGQVREIASNTANTITTTNAWATPPDATSVYYIYSEGTISSVLTALSKLQLNSDNGTATSGGANTLTDTTKDWDVNIWANGYIKIVAGTGTGQIRTIASNTANTITTTNAWATPPDATSKYEIVSAGILATLLIGTVYKEYAVDVPPVLGELTIDANTDLGGVNARVVVIENLSTYQDYRVQFNGGDNITLEWGGQLKLDRNDLSVATIRITQLGTVNQPVRIFFSN